MSSMFENVWNFNGSSTDLENVKCSRIVISEIKIMFDADRIHRVFNEKLLVAFSLGST